MPDARLDSPTLIFDGTCAFCTRSAEWVLERTRHAVTAMPYQNIDTARYGIDRERAAREALWIDAAGRVWAAHRAIAMALRSCRRPWSWLGALIDVPPLRWLAALFYRVVSALRGVLPGTTPACDRRRWDPQPRRLDGARRIPGGLEGERGAG